MSLIPGRCRLEEVRKRKGIGADGVRLALLDDFPPLVTDDVFEGGDISMGEGRIRPAHLRAIISGDFVAKPNVDPYLRTMPKVGGIILM